MRKHIEKIADKITDKILYWFFLFGFVLSLIPIFWLTYYNFPSADDLSASDDIRLAWLNTGSVFALLEAAWDNVVFNYLEWSGVYMSVFWTSLQPGIFGERFYFLTTVVTVLLLVISTFYLIHVLTDKYFPGKETGFRILGIIYLFILIQCMPDGNEGLFWHAGTANYTWAFAFLTILSAIMLSLYKETEKVRKYSKCILACIFAVFTGGGNYITALQAVFWTGSLCIIFIITDWKVDKSKLIAAVKKNISSILPTIVVFVSLIIAVIAPGNAERMIENTGMSPIKAIVLSFYYWLDISVGEWLRWPVAVLFAISVPVIYNIVKDAKYSFSFTGLLSIGLFCFCCATFTPALYAQSDSTGGRIWNTSFFVTILLFYVILFFVIGRISKRIAVFEPSGLYMIGMSLFFVCASALCMKADEKTYIASEAMHVILSGQAEIYKQENEERLKMYLDKDLKNVVVKRFTNPPELIHFEDNVADPGEWINLVVAKYYEKETVRSEE